MLIVVLSFEFASDSSSCPALNNDVLTLSDPIAAVTFPSSKLSLLVNFSPNTNVLPCPIPTLLNFVCVPVKLISSSFCPSSFVVTSLFPNSSSSSSNRFAFVTSTSSTNFGIVISIVGLLYSTASSVLFPSSSFSSISSSLLLNTFLSISRFNLFSGSVKFCLPSIVVSFTSILSTIFLKLSAWSLL